MKKFFVLSYFLSGFLVFPALYAQEQTVSLKLPEDFIAKTCPAAVWKGSSFAWKGVNDRRERREVGVQAKKGGKEPVLIFAQPDLESLLEDVVPRLLKACGLNLEAASADGQELSLEIKDFYAEVEKKLVTGSGKTRSNLQFLITRNGGSLRTVDVGYEIDEKKIRKGNIRQTEEALNELLRRTLEQVPKVEGF